VGLMRDLLRKYEDYIALAGLACLAAGIVRYFVTSEFNIYVQVLLGLGMILLLVYALGRPQELIQAFTGRRARYGSNVLVMSLAFIGILALINFLGARYERRLDWTQDRLFSISEQTRKVLADLDKPVKITGFFQEDDSRKERVQDLLKEYARHTNLLTWEFIDPDLQPALARQMGVTDYGTLVFECEGRRQNTFGSEEQDITSGILKVSRAEQKVIYFLIGHGERSIDDYGQNGYTKVKSLLEKDNYQVKTTNLAVTPTVPADAALLVIASPSKTFMDQEIEAVKSYLDKGGKLLYLTDPQLTSGLEESILAKYGITVTNDIIIDPASSLLGDAASPLITNFRWSMITKDLRAAAFFPQSRSLAYANNPPQGVNITSFAETSADSWGETDLTNRQARFDPEKDKKGPLSVGLQVTVERRAGGVTLGPSSRIVAFGDSDFASNAFLDAFGNRDLFANSVNWLTEEEALISIRAKPPTDRHLYITAQEQILGIVTSVIFLPLAVLLVGAVVWWRRK